MHYLVLGLVVVAATILFLIAAPRLSSGAENSSASPAPVTAAGKSTVRQQLEQKLLKLQKSSPKKYKHIGAMCYDIAPPPATTDYICPKDGERTQYPLKDQTYYLVRDIGSIRDMVRDINAIYLILDESEFCRKCSPDVKGPQLVLIVKVPGKPDHRYRGVTLEDVVLIKEFSEGKELHKGSYDEETPLKNYIPRLEKLLGITVPVAKQ